MGHISLDFVLQCLVEWAHCHLWQVRSKVENLPYLLTFLTYSYICEKGDAYFHPSESHSQCYSQVRCNDASLSKSARLGSLFALRVRIKEANQSVRLLKVHGYHLKQSVRLKHLSPASSLKWPSHEFFSWKVPQLFSPCTVVVVVAVAATTTATAVVVVICWTLVVYLFYFSLNGHSHSHHRTNVMLQDT